MLKNGIIRECFFVFLLVIVTACAYLNSLDGEFVFDDSRIYNNPIVQVDSFSVHKIVYAVKGMEPASRPVANLTFIINYLLHKFDVRGYHLVNLFIHIAAGIILYFFLKTMFALPVLRSKYQYSGEIAFFSAMIWLVHPLQTQAVSYIVQRMTSLSALFFILALFLYARGRLTENPDRRFFMLAGSVLSGLLGMGSKQVAVTLPLFILLYEWFFMQGLRVNWLKENKKYFVCVGILLITVPLLFLGDEPWRFISNGYANRTFTLSERMLTEFRIVFLYLGLLLFPHPGRLTLEHDVVLSTSLVTPLSTLPALAAIVGAILTAIFIAPKYRFASFCILWFLGNHVVEGSILPLELVFEHRNYLPSMMLVPLVVASVYRFIPSRKMIAAVFCVVVIVLSYWTYQRNFVWQNRISLWSDCVQKSPSIARSHNNLAVALKSKGRFEEALFHYRETIRLDPGFVEAYYNLGNIMMLQGDSVKAIEYYNRAVELNPDHFVLHMSLANALFDNGRYREARYFYLQSLRLDPVNMEAKMNLERTDRMISSLQQKTKRKADK